MTTRAQLESERHELRILLGNTRGADKARYSAITASIARVEALIGIHDDNANFVACALVMLSDIRPRTREYRDALATVAEIIRRTS